ncbi:class I SAM-dependent methyltransferase [Phycisphaera mikurensis]|uniref:Methyltransferase domain-containing protein n=1 Tax=Phycisphaera mikurensis (strain NBRC 102666 / KCTC 22515 / FYK2301M01) TaxID=1142394 RepID=I0IFR3_PHYMF|nr:class I SAM-dependent methyltransferase [Phycisphaera mikurensis]MBB6440509.1 SAM-dependent methyltransferase [Phycisphaera mikurensis]BAM04101.1 hypothetical protein PSMK_19420 [Phycisphaera mikurensis NBRC 102666]
MSSPPAPRTLPLAERLGLYADAVQQPLAEIRFVETASRHHRRGGGRADEPACLLREDFAGTCDVAAAWCRSAPERQAVAVEIHPPTLAWARRRHADVEDLHLVEADVVDFHGPRVDAITATNFSVLGFHRRPGLLRYLRHARRCLRPGGVFVMDLYGGPGAEAPGEQAREAGGFGYVWVQETYDPRTARARCRIRFTVRGRSCGGFRYDWRLWRPAELLDALAEAGFAEPTLWAADGRGRHRPGAALAAGEDFVVYLTGGRDTGAGAS